MIGYMRDDGHKTAIITLIGAASLCCIMGLVYVPDLLTLLDLVDEAPWVIVALTGLLVVGWLWVREARPPDSGKKPLTSSSDVDQLFK
jgi:hypothetical protein